MDLHPYVAAVAEDLGRATALADEPTREVAARIATAIDPALRLALTQALSDAAAAITAELDDAVVTCRMDGRDPVLEVRLVPDSPDPALAAAATPSGTDADEADGDTARVSLRLPEALKQRAETRAGAAGQSLNTWIVQTIRLATEPGTTPDPDRRAGQHRTRRVTGWA